MGRARAWIGASCLVAAAVLALAALVAAGADSRELSAPAASLAVAPSTVAPVAPPTTTSTAAPTTTMPATSTATTLPLSPLAAAVGEPISVLPVAPTAVSPPVRLVIDAIGVDTPIRAVGLEPDGQLEIPDETEVGWYRLGASPGEAGASVLAGHVNWNRVDGPFLRLRELEPGAIAVVTRADGSSRTYQVVERQQYAKDALPADRIWTHTGPETLVLITCGGSFNPEIRRFRDNIVVYAVPVA